MEINSICIVGGGSSGWMTAALLSKEFPKKKITLVESPDIPTMGVGESTLGYFNHYLHLLGLKDTDWMSKCDATYKTSIGFKNFREGKGERFQYPFGYWDHIGEGHTTFFKLQKLYGEDVYPAEEFARFCNKNTFLAEECKICDEIPFTSFSFEYDLAYQLNASKFGVYLRDYIAVPNGVRHIREHVNQIVRKEGFVESIITDHHAIVADLFIDCTGFKSLLLDSEFISFKDQLFNDKAIVTRIPYTDKETQMKTYTDCVGMNSGWAWNIPLWNEMSKGYVYSSRFISDEDAEKEFREHLNGYDGEFRHIEIKHGKHKEAWVNNVVAIGLSYGFVEPLESTGLLTTHENLLLLGRMLLDKSKINKSDISKFNKKVDTRTEDFKNFTIWHYFLSSRDDTPYWRAYKDVKIKGIVDHMERISNVLSTNNMGKDAMKNAGLVYIAGGMNCKPKDINLDMPNVFINGEQKSEDYLQILHSRYLMEKQSVLEWLKDQPSHYQYLKDNIYSSNK